MEPNLLQISGTTWVLGDIHGQFYDLVQLCLTKVDIEKDTLLFLGDYVDRGNFSIEVMLTLLILKLNRPQKVFLLRGNHECQQMTSYFNFYQ
jgi:serine/threonine-protein phosphatase 2B catalytic subunit